MGIFKRKTIIQVASVIYPLGDEPDRIPDIVQAAAITASLQNTPVAKAIRDSILDGVGVKLTQGYNYGVNGYYAGMPSALPQTYATKNDPTLDYLCADYLKTLYPVNVVGVVATTVVNDNDYDTVVQGLIWTEYHYDFYEQEVFLASGSIQLNAVLTLTGPLEDTVGHPGQVGYDLLFTNPDTTTVLIHKWYAGALFTNAKSVARRVVMRFTLDAGPKRTVSYADGTGYAPLNLFLKLLDEPVSGTFPAIVLKRDNVYLDTDAFTGTPWATSTAYRSSRTYARRLGLDLDDILARVKNNPDQGDIDFAFIQPGTLITATNVAVVKYHFNYFNTLRLALPDNKPAYDAWVTANSYPTHSLVSKNQAENCPAQSIHLADQDNPDSSLNIEIAWRYISYEVKSGTIPAEYTVECGAKETVTARYSMKVTFTETYEVTKLFLRKRLSPSTYAEICVCGLWHENYVYKGKSVQSAVWEAFNDPDDDFGTGFIIPLDHGVVVSLTPRERLQLGQEAFHMVFNCYVAKKQKWYQTGIFKVVLAIVSIVIIALTWGSAAPYVSAIYQSINVALIAAVGVTVAAALAAVFTGLIIVGVFAGVSLVSKEAGQWAAEHWGPGWGALVQIGVSIALTLGIGQMLPAPPGPPPPVSIIEQVLVSTSYILMGMSAYTQYQYVEFAKDQQAWKDYINSPTDPLQQVTEQLDEMFPGLNLAQKAILPHPESLDEFLGRTLTSVDGLTGRLLMPITNLAEMTLTPKLI